MDATVLESIESTKMSISANINDNFSVSYEEETSNPDYVTAASANYELESHRYSSSSHNGWNDSCDSAMNNHENSRYVRK